MNLISPFWIITLLIQLTLSFQRVHQSGSILEKGFHKQHTSRSSSGLYRRFDWTNGTTNPPVPCDGANFANPIYEMSNPKFEMRYLPGYGDAPVGEFDFRLRDVANNYTLICNWGPMDMKYQNPYPKPSKCVPEGVSNFDVFTNRITLDMRPDRTPVKNLSMTHVWVCQQKNGSYPLLYVAKATDFRFNANCSWEGPLNTATKCNISTDSFPIRNKASWSPPVHSTALTPRPLSAPTPSSRSSGPPKDCTDISFAHPDMVVDDFRYMPSAPSSGSNMTAHDLSFTMENYATGVRALCQPKHASSDTKSKGIDLDCSSIMGQTEDSFQTSSMDGYFEFESHKLSIGQAWTCSDTNGSHSTSFEARGSTMISLNCSANGDNPCSAGRTVVAGRLSRPVVLTPVPVPVPPNTNVSGCASISTSNPGWTIRRLEYHRVHKTGGQPIVWPFLPPAYDPDSRSLEVELVNKANGYVQACTITDKIIDGPNDRWFRCFPELNHTYPRYQIETWVQWDITTQRFGVNQTWYCNDTQASDGAPLVFTAVGSANPRSLSPFAFLCGTSNITEETGCIQFGKKRGIVPGCDTHKEDRWCSGPRDGLDLILPGTLVRQERLPPDAFTTPPPAPYGCTAASAGRSVDWHLQEWELRTWWWDFSQPDQTGSSLRFHLVSSALGGEVVPVYHKEYRETLTPYLPGSNPAAVYTKDIESSSASTGGADTSLSARSLMWTFRFDPVTMYLELNQTWYCDDEDPRRPIMFSGMWNGYVPLNCSIDRNPSNVSDHRWDDGISCGLAATDVVVSPVVTWYTSNHTAQL